MRAFLCVCVFVCVCVCVCGFVGLCVCVLVGLGVCMIVIFCVCEVWVFVCRCAVCLRACKFMSLRACLSHVGSISTILVPCGCGCGLWFAAVAVKSHKSNAK